MSEKKKLVMLPLDERPCNFAFPGALFRMEDIELVLPEALGNKKNPAELDKAAAFLREECENADAAIISIDTLLYGGLIPSRLHSYSRSEVMERLELLRELRDRNKKLRIYAFTCIMRCPRYSSSDEEPDYYEDCGAEIHRLGRLIHMKSLGLELTPPDDEESEERLREKIGAENLEDYIGRRRFNLEFNLETIRLVREGLIDFLVIPQDDSARYGYTAMDQVTVRRRLAEEGLLGKVLVYPGADEVGLTLLSRAINELRGRTPGVYVKYASTNAPFITPPYEDRSLNETVKYQLLAAGCMMVECVAEADFLLALCAPGGDICEASHQPVENPAYDVERNLPEFVSWIKKYIDKDCVVGLCDNAYANGGDLQLLSMLNNEGLLYRLAGYAGWNTNANSLGTVIAQAVVYLYRGDTKENREFLALRYLEDCGYCGTVRSYVTKHELQGLGMNYFDVQEEHGVVSKIVEGLLNDFRRDKLSSIADTIEICDVRMPWKRMFEVGLEVRCKA